jgi:hypothetical protein
MSVPAIVIDWAPLPEAGDAVAAPAAVGAEPPLDPPLEPVLDPPPHAETPAATKASDATVPARCLFIYLSLSLW